MKQISRSEWKLIVNAGVVAYSHYAAAKLIRVSDITYSSGVKIIRRLVDSGIMYKVAISGRSYRLVLTEIGVNLREILLKL